MLIARERRVVQVTGMKCLRKVLGVRVIQRIRNGDFKRGNEVTLLGSVDQRTIRWFSHVKRSKMIEEKDL